LRGKKLITLREGPNAPYLTDRDQKSRVSASESLLMLRTDRNFDWQIESCLFTFIKQRLGIQEFRLGVF